MGAVGVPVTVSTVVAMEPVAVPTRGPTALLRPTAIRRAAALKLVTPVRLMDAAVTGAPSMLTVSEPDNACNCARVSVETPPRSHAPTDASA